MRLFNPFVINQTNNRPSPKRLPTYLTVSLVSAGLLTLSACVHEEDDDDDDMAATQATYQVTVHNLTNGQTLTPLGVVIHESGYQPWMLGDAVSVGLETLAESGATTAFLAEADANAAVAMSAGSTSGGFGPGTSQMVSITVDHTASLQLSVASMLADTNDAFTGVRNWDIGTLAMGDSASTMTYVFDAGTEANTETADTMPGPVAQMAGGMAEGFNATRETLNKLTIHSGVLTTDDGLETSALNESHRWLGQAAKVVVTRTQ